MFNKCFCVLFSYDEERREATRARMFIELRHETQTPRPRKRNKEEGQTVVCYRIYD